MQFESQTDGSTLDDFIDPVTALVSETRLQVGEDTFRTTAADPASVAMVDFQLDTRAFDTYDAEEAVLGIDLDRFAEFTSMASSDDTVDIDYDNDANALNITVADELNYTQALIDPDSIRSDPDIPDLEYNATVTVTADELARGLTAAEMVNDHVSLSYDADNNEFVIAAEGDTDDVNYTIDGDGLVEVEDGAGTAESLFSLDYLTDMESAIPSDAEVTIELGDDIPTKLHFEAADGDAEVMYMLAPRIQNA